MAGRDADPFWWICLTDILMLAKVTECPRWFFIISTSYSRAPWGKNIEKIKSGKDMLQCCMLHESRVCCSKWLNFTNCFLSHKYETRALRCTFFYVSRSTRTELMAPKQKWFKQFGSNFRVPLFRNRKCPRSQICHWNTLWLDEHIQQVWKWLGWVRSDLVEIEPVFGGRIHMPSKRMIYTILEHC